MNSLANHFKQILSTLTHGPESARLERLLANFASKVATQSQTLTNSSNAETKQLEAQVEKLEQIFRPLMGWCR